MLVAILYILYSTILVLAMFNLYNIIIPSYLFYATTLISLILIIYIYSIKRNLITMAFLLINLFFLIKFYYITVELISIKLNLQKIIGSCAYGIVLCVIFLIVIIYLEKIEKRENNRDSK